MTKAINVIFFAIFSVFLLTACSNSGSNKTSEKELDLQKRELDLKQKELELKEKELTQQQNKTSATSTTTVAEPSASKNAPTTSPSTESKKNTTVSDNLDNAQKVAFKSHNPCSFSVSLPTTFKLVSQNYETSPDYCDYEVKLTDGSVIIQIHSLLNSRFSFDDIKKGESDIKYLYRRALSKSKLDITYKTQKENWFVISGIDKSNGKINYWKRVSGSNFISDLSIEYTKSQALQIEPYIGKIATSFSSQ
jgi:hypothetical protein